MTIISKAYFFAEKIHKDQVYGKEPFLFHLEQTYKILTALMPKDHNLRASGLLHDTMEDKGITYEEIKKEFNEDIASLVQEVTKTGYNTFPQLRTIRGVILLTASRLCNLANMQDWSEEQKARYVKKSTFWLS